MTFRFKNWFWGLLILSLLLSACSIQLYHPDSQNHAAIERNPTTEILENSTNTKQPQKHPQPATVPNQSASINLRPTLTLPDQLPFIQSDSAFSITELEQISSLIETDIEQDFPGAVLLIAHQNQILFERAYGFAKKYDQLAPAQPPQPMTTQTLFDLASLTKSYSTGLAIMYLEAKGKLHSDDLIGKYLPDYINSPITISQLLAHQSGLPASYPFYKPNKEYHSLERQKTYRYLAQLAETVVPEEQEIYSDLGYILLGQVIEKITNQPLDQFVEKQIYQPLGLKSTCYAPLEKGFSANQIAATERMGNTRDGQYPFDGARTYTLQGQVHDELAFYSMNQISGNAGLFSTAEEVSILAHALLTADANSLIPASIIQKYWRPYRQDARYGLGFDIAPHPKNQTYYGSQTSPQAVAKTGWTGTVCLIDPAHQLIIVLLTNKRHTPYLNGQFQAATYPTGRYQPIISAIYQALESE